MLTLALTRSSNVNGVQENHPRKHVSGIRCIPPPPPPFCRVPRIKPNREIGGHSCESALGPGDSSVLITVWMRTRGKSSQSAQPTEARQEVDQPPCSDTGYLYSVNVVLFLKGKGSFSAQIQNKNTHREHGKHVKKMASGSWEMISN